jgi:alpha,alpha-trehalose phosphorylase
MRYHIRAVLFNLDGAVFDTAAYHRRVWECFATERGWRFDEELEHMVTGLPPAQCVRIVLAHNGIELSPKEQMELNEQANACLWNAYGELGLGDLRPGVLEIVEQFRARGLKCGAYALNGAATETARRLGLERRFDTLVNGPDHGYADWSPALYETCVHSLRVPPFHCLIVESSTQGVQAATAARMKVLGVGDVALKVGAREAVSDFGTVHVDFLLDSGRVTKYPEEPWALTETAPRPGRARYWETLFALTNGLIGLRGTHEEEDSAVDGCSYPGMFLNSIYGYRPYAHIVAFPGYPERMHAMLNLADWRIINLWVNGVRFSPYGSSISDFRRSLDLRDGLLKRSLVWHVPGGGRVRVRSTRVVSMTNRHVAAIRYEVTPLDRDVRVALESAVRATVASEELGPDQTRVVSAAHDADSLTLHIRPTTAESDIGMAFVHSIEPAVSRRKGRWEVSSGERYAKRFEMDVGQNTNVVCDKFAAFFTSVETAADKVVHNASREVTRVAREGFEALVQRQCHFWDDYWRIADVIIEGDMADQQAVRFSLFHLRQSNPEDDRRSIGANGMTGDKYRGHVFWDTEMYLVPHFLYTEPHGVRPLLMYRYDILERARERARQMGGVGALYAWDSITGEECSVVFEASTAEYHLLPAIGYAIWRYEEATGDREFLFHCGAEILFETARFLEDLGAYVPHKDGAFCINAVCGPDEYGCGANNNCYTNVMTQWHLRYAAEVYERMAREQPSVLSQLSARIGLDTREPAGWRGAADAMYVPYNEKLGIHEQHDGFLGLNPVDMSMIPRNTDIREIMHPLNLWRSQVLKQADVVLLMFVQGHLFDTEIKRRNYEFYEPRTCHGSSLSAGIHAIVAAEIGKPREAYDYFRESATMDLNDFKDNTGGGIHSACLGCTWMAIVNGFGGMRDYPDGLRFSPMLPEVWQAYSFNVFYRGARIGVEVRGTEATYRLLEGDRVRFTASGQTVELAVGASEQATVTLAVSGQDRACER